MLIQLISFPKASDHKVAGIKALRGAFKIGLKEAKDLIEDLQAREEYTLNCVDREALKVFEQHGGIVGEVNVVLIEQLTHTARTAIDGREFDLAIEVIELLKKFTT